ncbi:hypothetical protein HLB03_04290 [Acidianus sp. DSM 29099]|nr:hypothetical protein [Acidianus sp. RZ1]
MTLYRYPESSKEVGSGLIYESVKVDGSKTEILELNGSFISMTPSGNDAL